MPEIVIGIFSALWLGILTSISPCPLATNIVAVSYIDRKITSTSVVLLTGLFYTLGRMVTYMVLGMIIVLGILASKDISFVLQNYMNKILGPLLILVGMILLELIQFAGRGSGLSEKTQQKIASMGIWGGAVLGIIFALSFCPISAALFFLSLIPLASKLNSAVLLPALYGVGTGLPVFIFAVLVALSAKTAAKAFNKVVKVEFWVRRITGVVFIIIGVYFCLAYIFRLI